jgi:hypothetical protein
MTTMIRKIYNQGTSLAYATLDTAKDVAAPVVTGLALGAIGVHAALDRKGVPLDAISGVALRAANAFSGHLPSKGVLGKVRGFIGHHHDVIEDIGAAAIGAGTARLGARLASGGKPGATHHGELGGGGGMPLTPAMGLDPLSAYADKL